MTAPALPPTWTDEHSLALILLSVSAVDGQMDTDEITQVGERVKALRSADVVDPVEVTQDAYEHLMRLAQHLENDAALIDTVQEHCVRLATKLDEDTKERVLQAIVTIAEADGRLDPSEVAAYRVATTVWSQEDA